MSDVTDLDHWRRRIERALADLDAQDELGRDGQGTVALDQQSVGRLSRMDAIQQQAMAQAAQRRRSGERSRLKAALARLEEGEFGYCEDCGDPIPVGRLELDPAALKCRECAAG